MSARLPRGKCSASLATPMTSSESTSMETSWPAAAMTGHAASSTSGPRSRSPSFTTTSRDKTVRIYEVASLHCVRSCVGHTDHVFDVAWSDQDECIASCSHDHTCNIYEPKLGA